MFTTIALASFAISVIGGTISFVSLWTALGSQTTALHNQIAFGHANRMDLIRTQHQRTTSRYETCEAIQVLAFAIGTERVTHALKRSDLGNCVRYSHQGDLNIPSS